MKPNDKLKELERATSTHVEYIDALTGLRGLAACWVLLFHLWMAAKPRKMMVELLGEEFDLTILFSGGWIGVDIFFVLSGFLLAIPFLKQRLLGQKAVDIPRYFRRRLYRVLPAYYVQLVLLILVAIIFTRDHLPGFWNLLSHALMIHNLRFEFNEEINRVYWTLPVEFGFYLLLPLLMFWIRTPKQLLWLLILSIIVSVSYRYLSFHWISDASVPRKQWLLNQLPGRLSQFVSGIYFAWLYLYLSRRLKGKNQQWFSRLAFTLGLFGIIGALYFFTGGRHKLFWQGHWSLFTWYSFSGLAIALLVLGLSLNRGLISRLFNNPAMLFLGLISYSLYLWHYPLVEGLAHSDFIRSINGYRLPQLMLVSLPLVLVVSSLSYYFVERPFLLIRKG